jgi:hypothetical protein
MDPTLVSWIQATPSHPGFLAFILILFSHLHPAFQNGIWNFSYTKFCIRFSFPAWHIYVCSPVMLQSWVIRSFKCSFFFFLVLVDICKWMLSTADCWPNKIYLNSYAVCASCDDTEDSWKVSDGGIGDVDDDYVLVDLDFFFCVKYTTMWWLYKTYLTFKNRASYI